jgi:transcriptional regulator with XRE-family HTH domain
MDIADAIRILREKLGLTQEEFGARIGVTGRAIRRYEARDRRPDVGALAGFAGLAAEADRHDLAYLFTRALVKELRLERLQLGIFSAPARPKEEDSPGIMLIAFRGREAQNYARAFFETFGRFLYGTAEEQQRAGALLDQFNLEAFREWRGQ